MVKYCNSNPGVEKVGETREAFLALLQSTEDDAKQLDDVTVHQTFVPN